MYYRRDIEKSLIEAGQSFQSIVLYGARQVGKSTTVLHVFGDKFNYVSLDDYDELDVAINNPKAFLDIHSWPLIIDEVQKAPKLLSYIKDKIDAQRLSWLQNNQKRELMYILTGSNQFELQQGISESLAGRAAVINISSLTQMEINKCDGDIFDPHIDSLLKKEKSNNVVYKNEKQIFETIFSGGMPDIVTGESKRDIYFKSYLDTYIEKDVRKLISSSHEMQFRRFVSYIALRTGTQVNYEVFSRELGIDSATCRRWMSILETSGIIILLEPYMSSMSNRIIKAPKLYFLDTGLCSYLCKWPNANMLQDGVMGGAFFETFVISEIVKSFYNHNQDPKRTLFYYRDIDQKEIDLLYVNEEGIYPIEIKKNNEPTKPNKNFNVLLKYKTNIAKGLIINTTDKIRPINENVYSFPVYLLGI